MKKRLLLLPFSCSCNWVHILDGRQNTQIVALQYSGYRMPCWILDSVRFNQVESHPTLPLRAVGKGQVRDAVPVASLSLSTKATKLPTKLATKLMKALKGRNIPAQGNALGNGQKND
jgi:hypothetical protein